MRTVIFFLLLISAFQVNGQTVNTGKKYHTKSTTAGNSFLYINDIDFENSLATEPISVTVTRFDAITGVSKFTRTGTGSFKMIINNNLVHNMLANYFHFTEAEIIEKAKVR